MQTGGMGVYGAIGVFTVLLGILKEIFTIIILYKGIKFLTVVTKEKLEAKSEVTERVEEVIVEETSNEEK